MATLSTVARGRAIAIEAALTLACAPTAATTNSTAPHLARRFDPIAQTFTDILPHGTQTFTLVSGIIAISASFVLATFIFLHAHVAVLARLREIENLVYIMFRDGEATHLLALLAVVRFYNVLSLVLSDFWIACFLCMGCRRARRARSCVAGCPLFCFRRFLRCLLFVDFRCDPSRQELLSHGVSRILMPSDSRVVRSWIPVKVTSARRVRMSQYKEALAGRAY